MYKSHYARAHVRDVAYLWFFVPTAPRPYIAQGHGTKNPATLSLGTKYFIPLGIKENWYKVFPVFIWYKVFRTAYPLPVQVYNFHFHP